MIAVLALCAHSAWAAPQPTDAEFEKWADDTLAAATARHGASGISAALIRDGHIVYLKGFGHSDARETVAVEPNEALFSIGSITKSFTATAVAQLLERGQIHSLDDPANKYLRRFRLPDTRGRSITVRNLLTHRGGLDESVFELASLSAVPVPITAAQIQERLPPAVRAPGEISVYSNVGYGVLSLMIEDITGITYGEYLRRNVFVPLGMTHSFIRYQPTQPIAQPLDYGPEGGAPIPQSWVYHPFIAGSASLVSTVGDMARFALAHLNAEHDQVPELMNAGTARLMHDRSTANAPFVAGFGLSFIANAWNGTRVTENAGSGPGFQALFILLPDVGVGFVALIAGGAADPGLIDSLKTRLRGREAGTVDADPSLKMFALRESFLNFYLGPLQPVTGPPSTLPLAQFTGTFRSERRPHLTSQALFLTGTALHVSLDGSDALTINGQHGYRQIAANTFWKPGVAPYVPDDASSDMYVFVPDGNGKIRYVAPYLAVDVYKPAYLDPTTAQFVTLALCLVCGTGLLALRWRTSTRAQRTARLLAIVLGAGALAVPISVVLALWKYGSPMFMIGFGNVGVLEVATALATSCAVLVALLVATVVYQRLSVTRVAVALPAAVKWHVAVLICGGVALVAMFATYNLIGNHVP